MTNIEPGAKRREFVKNITPKIKEFWVGWFGGITFYKKPFKPVSSKSKAIAKKIIVASILLSIPHALITHFSEDGWWAILVGLLYSFWAFVVLAILGFIGFIAITVLSLIYRIIRYRDIQIFDTYIIIFNKLGNLFSRGVIYWPLVIFFSFIIHLGIYFEY